MHLRAHRPSRLRKHPIEQLFLLGMDLALRHDRTAHSEIFVREKKIPG